jgi:hypothetical protein
MSGQVKLPVTEKNYHSSVNRAKGRMKKGSPIVTARTRGLQVQGQFFPRYAPKVSLQGVGEGRGWFPNKSSRRFPALSKVHGPSVIPTSFREKLPTTIVGGGKWMNGLSRQLGLRKV